MHGTKSKVRKEVVREYYRFKRNIMKRGKKDIYESCGKIYFYACIFEYFNYNTEISESVLHLFIKYRLSIDALWETYLKEEETSIATWDKIGELIFAACKRKGAKYDRCEAGAC